MLVSVVAQEGEKYANCQIKKKSFASTVIHSILTTPTGSTKKPLSESFMWTTDIGLNSQNEVIV